MLPFGKMMPNPVIGSRTKGKHDMIAKKNEGRKSRHKKYRVGTCKLTVTVENEDKVRVERKAERTGYKDTSSFLRELIHEAVWDEPLTAEDYDKLKEMRKQQEES